MYTWNINVMQLRSPKLGKNAFYSFSKKPMWIPLSPQPQTEMHDYRAPFCLWFTWLSHPWHNCHIPYITYRGHQFALQHRSLLLDICGRPKQLGPPRLWWVVGLTPGLACSCLRQKEQLRLQCKVSNISEYHRRQSHDRFNVHWDSLVPGIPQRQLRHFMAVLGSSASVANPCLGTSLDGWWCNCVLVWE